MDKIFEIIIIPLVIGLWSTICFMFGVLSESYSRDLLNKSLSNKEFGKQINNDR